MAESALMTQARGSHSDLSPRAAEFLKRYLAGPPGVRYNGVRSVMACGWTTNEASAGVTAGRLLRNAAVQRALARHAEAAHSTAEKAIARTALRAYSTVKDVLTYDQDGKVTLIPTADLSEAGAAMVGGIKARVTTTTGADGTPVETRTLEIKLRDDDGARRDLLRLHGLLVERREVSGPDGGAISINVYIPQNDRDAEPRQGAATAKRITPSPLALPPVDGPTNGGSP